MSQPEPQTRESRARAAACVGRAEPPPTAAQVTAALEQSREARRILGRAHGPKRWRGVSKAERSAIMSQVAKCGLGVARARKEAKPL